jgi:hypothetical protein
MSWTGPIRRSSVTRMLAKSDIRRKSLTNLYVRFFTSGRRRRGAGHGRDGPERAFANLGHALYGWPPPQLRNRFVVADIFREVDEEVRREHYAKLWRKYGPYVIALAVALVLAVAGREGWRHYDEQRRFEQSARFADALNLLDTGATSEAIAALNALAEDGGPGYAALAGIRAAQQLAKDGKIEAAVAAYDRVAENGAAPLDSLAVVLAGYLQVDRGDPATVRGRIEPLLEPGNPWRPAAMEIAALLAVRGGDRDQARELYRGLADDAATPAALRARATEILAALKG